jgi:ABC-type Zn2+ transport system substrate-binding protein/surface adhesin
VLDPLGAGLPPGTDQYAQLLRALADNLVACLGGTS